MTKALYATIIFLACLVNTTSSSLSAQIEGMIGVNFLSIRDTHGLTVDNKEQPSGFAISLSIKDSLRSSSKLGTKLIVDLANFRYFNQDDFLGSQRVNLLSAGGTVLITNSPLKRHNIGIGPSIQLIYSTNVERWRRIYNSLDYGITASYHFRLNENVGFGIRAFLGMNELFTTRRIDELGNLEPERDYFKSTIVTPYISIML